MKTLLDSSCTRLHVRSVRAAIAVALLFGGAATSPLRAQTVYNYSTGTYTQSFDSLPNTNSTTADVNASTAPTINGTTYTLPTGANATNSWYLSGTAPGTTSPFNTGGNGTVGFGPSLPGWYAEGSVADQAGASYGDQTKGGLISFGGLNSTNRAIGLLSTSTSGTNVFGFELTNNSGGSLNSVTISYTGELFRQTTTANPLNFGYLVDNTATVTPPKATTTVASGTTAVAGLNVSFTAGTAATGTTTGTPVSTTNISQTFTLATAWANNGNLFLTWDQGNSAGGAQGIAIDGFNFSATNTATPANVTWNVINGTWDTTTANWTGGTPTANLYKNGDNAFFTNTAGGTVTINTTLTPGSTTDSAASGTYAFTGAGSINGSGTLTKSGGGTLDLTGMSVGNGYTGGTNLNGGTLIVSNDNQLGGSASALIFAGGTLQTNTAGITSTRNLTINTGAGTFNTNGLNSSTSGTTSINDVLTVSGGGNLALNGAVTFGATTGSLAINAGSVTFGQTAGTISMNNGGTFTGNLVVANAVRVNFDNTTAFTGTGQIQVQTTNTILTNLSGAQPGTVNVNIGLNSANTAFTKGDVTQSTYAPGNFSTNIGGTSATGTNVLVIGGVISGASDLNIANSGTGGGASNLMLSAVNTYSGTTTINSKATVSLGVDNALPTTTDVIFGTQTGVSSAALLDLNGHMLAIGSLSSGVNASGYGVTNGGSTASTLTVSGTTTPANPFTGILKDGGTSTTSLSLTKGGTNTLTLTGVNTFIGSTVVNGGTLSAATTGGAALGATGQVRVNGGGTLLLATANQVNAVAPVIMTGGLINIAGAANQGSGATLSNGAASGTSTLGLGALTLAANSTLGYLGTNGTVVFTGFDPTNGNSGTTYVLNVTGGSFGTSTNSADGSNNRLIFNQNVQQSGFLGDITFNGVANAVQTPLGSSGYYEITPVPEPSTFFGGLLLVGALGWSQRRRLSGLVRWNAIGRRAV